jgi:hypothetical protein
MKLDYSHIELSKGPRQIKDAFGILKSTPNFILRHELWKGFGEHKWVLIFSIVTASLFTLTLYNDLYDYFFPGIEESIDIPTEDIDETIYSVKNAIADLPSDNKADLSDTEENLDQLKASLKGDNKPLFSGSLKFLMLIFLEVFIFHFSVKTNNILTNENKILSFKDFVKAQKRMIIVMGRKWIAGLLMFILISILCGLSGMNAFKDIIMFFIYGFYLGFAFLDNYLEQFDVTIKNSVKCIQTHFGASAFFGILASLLMSIPFIGPLIAPILFGIAATRYGHATKMETFG